MIQLRRTMKDLKLHLSQKDGEIRGLEQELSVAQSHLNKDKKEMARLKRQNEDLSKNKYINKSRRSSLDNENSNLREENRKLTAQIEALQDQHAIVVAKLDSLSPDGDAWRGDQATGWQTSTRPSKTTNQSSPWKPLVDVSQPLHPRPNRDKAPNHGGAIHKTNKNSGAIPKTHSRPAKTAAPSKPHPASTHRKEPTRAPGAASVAQPGKPKVHAAVIGASNMRSMGSRLQSSELDSTVWVNPGCGFQHVDTRTRNMTTDKTDVVVVHLGTNNCVSDETEGQSMIHCLRALNTMERAHRDMPVIMCSVPPTRDPQAQVKVDNMNALIQQRCDMSHNMDYLDTNLTLNDIGRDGIHMTASGKDKLAMKIKIRLQSFQKDRSLRPK